MRSYSQIKAMLAITRASLRSILRSPSAVIFSIAFPLIFILVFGFLSSGGNFNVKVALAPNADTTNLVYTKIKSLAELKFITADQAIVDAELAKGRIIALIDIQPTQNPSQPYQIQLTSSAAANPQNIEVIKSILNAVIAKQASLIAQWMHIGFIHGVMNTDNMSISGETIDYGPCAFMDHYHPETVFSSIDRQGRYAYVNQPPIAQWNLARFAETLLPLIDQDADKSIELASQAINNFSDQFQMAWLQGMRQKIGLFNEESADIDLINDLLALMQKNKADYTLTFRHLSSDAILKDVIFKDMSFKAWYKNWLYRVKTQKEGEEASRHMMLKHNPAVIPRNYLVEQALSMAVIDQDYTLLNDFIEALLSPYEDSKIFSEPPLEEDKTYQTFCGT